MLADPPASGGSELQQQLAYGLGGPAGSEAVELAAFVARGFGPGTIAVLHYGSRAQGRVTGPNSAFDFIVIVESDRRAYRSLKSVVGTSYPVWLASVLAWALPPNVVSVTGPSANSRQRAKCLILNRAEFQRACSGRPRDHFVPGRLIQLVLLVWAKDDAASQFVTSMIASVRARSFTWTGPSLPATFSVDDFTHAMLARSFAGEIRPEPADHARTLADAQQTALRAIYGPLLASLAAAGVLAAVGPEGRYHVPPASRRGKRRVGVYFAWSKVRATVRLFKHVALYDGWLAYIVDKIARSGGEAVVLTERERRWPLLFLWPRAWRYLRTRPQHQTRSKLPPEAR